MPRRRCSIVAETWRFGWRTKFDARVSVVRKRFQRPRNGAETLAPAFAPVAGDQQVRKLAVCRKKALGDLEDSIDRRIAGDVDLSRHAFVGEIPRRQFCWCEEQFGPGVDCGAIFLFGPGQRRIVRAKPGFDVCDWHSRGERRKRSAERARRVALDD